MDFLPKRLVFSLEDPVGLFAMVMLLYSRISRYVAAANTSTNSALTKTYSASLDRQDTKMVFCRLSDPLIKLIADSNPVE